MRIDAPVATTPVEWLRAELGTAPGADVEGTLRRLEDTFALGGVEAALLFERVSLERGGRDVVAQVLRDSQATRLSSAARLPFSPNPQAPRLLGHGPVRIGRYEVPRLGLGAMRLVAGEYLHDGKRLEARTLPSDPEKNRHVVLNAVHACGVRYVDVARGYGPWPGAGEGFLREWLAPYPRDLLWATKVGYQRDDAGGWRVDLDPQVIARDTAASCAQLGTPIPLSYLVVRSTPEVPVDHRPARLADSLEPLLAAQRRGEIENIGVANVTAAELRELMAAGPIAAVQNKLTLASLRDPLQREVIELCAQHGIPFVGWGIFGEAEPVAVDPQLEATARQLGMTHQELTIALMLHAAPNIVLLPGCGSERTLFSSVAAHNRELPPEVLARFGLAAPVPPPAPTAFVSGMGPNGMLATLELLQQGYSVTTAEQRPDPTRPIHLSLRETYLSDIGRHDPALSEELMKIVVPLQQVERVDLRGGGSHRDLPAVRAAPPSEPTIEERLQEPHEYLVRIDELEALFAAHLEELRGRGARLTVVRGYATELEHDAGSDAYGVRLRRSKYTGGGPDSADVMELGRPDLVVLAEGGKSHNLQDLALEPIHLSGGKRYLSGHVSQALGPISRRVDTNVEAADGSRIPVSVWATGHADPSKGTWMVMEVPDGMVLDPQTSGLDYFASLGALPFLYTTEPSGEADVRGALRPAPTGADAAKVSAALRAGIDAPFFGTFKFTQQLRPVVTRGSNLVVFGDGSGMGHHHYSTGLEVAAHDLRDLRRLARAIAHGDDRHAALARYGKGVLATRVALLAVGMKEYYPEIDFDPTALVAEAVRTVTEGDGGDPRQVFEALLASHQRARLAPALAAA